MCTYIDGAANISRNVLLNLFASTGLSKDLTRFKWVGFNRSLLNLMKKINMHAGRWPPRLWVTQMKIFLEIKLFMSEGPMTIFVKRFYDKFLQLPSSSVVILSLLGSAINNFGHCKDGKMARLEIPHLTFLVKDWVYFRRATFVATFTFENYPLTNPIKCSTVINYDTRVIQKANLQSVQWLVIWIFTLYVHILKLKRPENKLKRGHYNDKKRTPRKKM